MYSNSFYKARITKTRKRHPKANKATDKCPLWKCLVAYKNGFTHEQERFILKNENLV